jgi:hypothetical protein
MFRPQTAPHRAAICEGLQRAHTHLLCGSFYCARTCLTMARTDLSHRKRCMPSRKTRPTRSSVHRTLGQPVRPIAKFGVALDAFPDNPKGMHWRTYERLRRAYDIVEAVLHWD